MSELAHIGLDNPVFRGRLRVPFERSRPAPPARSNYLTARSYDDQIVASAPSHKPVPAKAESAPTPVVTPPVALATQRPPVEPYVPKQQRSRVLRRESVRLPHSNGPARSGEHHYSRTQLVLISLACLMAICGLGVTLQSLRTNHAAAAQIAVLSKKADKQPSNNQSTPVPSTTKPSSQSIGQYVVAPDLARYLKIPKLGVYARVLQVGVTTSGALGTPNNVYDTAWYTGSAKPGQPGATLIDGHVSSWTTHGVFYGIKTLVAGDTIQIVRGDGTVLNYQVVKTQTYDADNVDMQAAVTPITAGKPGLNLITCTGQVKKGTSEFNQRVVVYAEQV